MVLHFLENDFERLKEIEIRQEYKGIVGDVIRKASYNNYPPEFFVYLRVMTRTQRTIRSFLHGSYRRGRVFVPSEIRGLMLCRREEGGAFFLGERGKGLVRDHFPDCHVTSGKMVLPDRSEISFTTLNDQIWANRSNLKKETK